MSRMPTSRTRRALGILPVAVLSAAWTAHLTGVGVAQTPPATSAMVGHPSRLVLLPGGTVVPPIAPTRPATVGTHEVSAASPVLTGDVSPAVAQASADDIPAVALSAYQRAESVIDSADRSCHLSWQLLAAIGRVESDHGSSGGSTLTAAGFDVPRVLGPVLDGRNGTSRVLDTDGGRYDHDPRYDRAVGPMQFLPSTWAVAGVDADGDGIRNPQDINDAALAAAVYLCSGQDDLATPAGLDAAVFRYNHSRPYVAAVVAIMRRYTAGDYLAAPDTVLDAGTLTVPPTTSAPDDAPDTVHDAASPLQVAVGVPLSSVGDGAGPRRSDTSSPLTSGPSAPAVPTGPTVPTGSGGAPSAPAPAPDPDPTVPGHPVSPVPTVPTVPTVPQAGDDTCPPTVDPVTESTTGPTASSPPTAEPSATPTTVVTTPFSTGTPSDDLTDPETPCLCASAPSTPNARATASTPVTCVPADSTAEATPDPARSPTAGH